MIKRLKKAIYNKLTEAGYNVTDSGRYEEEFPWLMVRTGNIQKTFYSEVSVEVIDIVVDIFSTDPTEKELLDIEDDVTRLIRIVGQDLPFVMNSKVSSATIIDDNSFGPIKKHGVFTYQFMVAAEETYIKEDEDGTIEETTE